MLRKLMQLTPALFRHRLPTDAMCKQVSGPNGKVIAAPSSKLHKPPPRRNWVPAPDVQRIGPGAETPDGNPHAYRRTTLSYIKGPSPEQWAEDVSVTSSGVSLSRLSRQDSNTPRCVHAQTGHEKPAKRHAHRIRARTQADAIEQARF